MQTVWALFLACLFFASQIETQKKSDTPVLKYIPLDCLYNSGSQLMGRDTKVGRKTVPKRPVERF